MSSVNEGYSWLSYSGPCRNSPKTGPPWSIFLTYLLVPSNYFLMMHSRRFSEEKPQYSRPSSRAYERKSSIVIGTWQCASISHPCPSHCAYVSNELFSARHSSLSHTPASARTRWLLCQPIQCYQVMQCVRCIFTGFWSRTRLGLHWEIEFCLAPLSRMTSAP